MATSSRSSESLLGSLEAYHHFLDNFRSQSRSLAVRTYISPGDVHRAKSSAGALQYAHAWVPTWRGAARGEEKCGWYGTLLTLAFVVPMWWRCDMLNPVLPGGPWSYDMVSIVHELCSQIQIFWHCLSSTSAPALTHPWRARAPRTSSPAYIQ